MWIHSLLHINDGAKHKVLENSLSDWGIMDKKLKAWLSKNKE